MAAAVDTRNESRDETTLRDVLGRRPDDLAGRQLEMVDVLAAEPCGHPLAAPVHELDPHVRADDDEPLDLDLDGAVAREPPERDLVRADEAVAELERVAEEAEDELRRGVVVELGRPADLLEAAAVEDGDAVGDLHRLLLVVRHEHGRHVHLRVQAAEPVAQLGSHARVERAERLVEEQDARLRGERAGERHPLPLAARELVRIAVGVAVQLDEIEELVDALADLLLRPLPDRQREADVVAHGHVLERRVVLEDEADVALLRRQARSRPCRRAAPRRSRAARGRR